MIKVGSDFSGVGAFNQALMRLGIEYNEVFACDMDKYARETFIHNYGEPKYYPKDVYEREIPKESLDIYMTSPPCQAFSLAGKRLGKEDKRGVLFFNSHEFIKKNKPRYFIFENVKGLLSDDNGNTFKEWVNMLGGKSVNGLPVLFPYEDSVPYHIYYKVVNAKKHGVPQNRERVFIIGVRDDQDNTFRWAKQEHLTKRLKDVLQVEVLQKFYLSKKAIANCKKNEANKDIQVKEVSDISKCIVAGYYKTPTDSQYIKVSSNLEKYFLSRKMLEKITFESKQNGVVANLNKGGERGAVYDINSDYMSCLSATDYKQPKQILVNQLNKSKESGGVQPYQQNRVYDVSGINPALNAGQEMWGGNIVNTEEIRRLTPRECFRLMDFPDTFTWTCSDSQAYKQAGNSIVVRCLELIIKEFRI